MNGQRLHLRLAGERRRHRAAARLRNTQAVKLAARLGAPPTLVGRREREHADGHGAGAELGVDAAGVRARERECELLGDETVSLGRPPARKVVADAAGEGARDPQPPGGVERRGARDVQADVLGRDAHTRPHLGLAYNPRSQCLEPRDLLGLLALPLLVQLVLVSE